MISTEAPFFGLNEGALARLEPLLRKPEDYKVLVRRCNTGATIIDAGIDAVGGLNAGLELAAICLANRANVILGSGPKEVWEGAWVSIASDWPILACMASQYAGWNLSHGKFFAMGSGPMRAAAAKEELLKDLAICESARRVVGVLETRKLPPDEVIELISQACRVSPHEVFLVVAPTASYAGTVQVVARSVETALHKLHELGFDLNCVESAWGTAPLPPIAKDDLSAIGWTNDAVLYGASVCLWANTTDQAIEEVIEKVASAASPDYGRPFLEIFEAANRDFYKIDPMLFSPAKVMICNRRTGHNFSAGVENPQVLRESFLGKRRI